MTGLIPRRFIIHIVVLSIWTAALGYAALTSTVRSPVTVNPVPASMHITSASTQCHSGITCAVTDTFQTSCPVASGGTSVSCGNTVVLLGEKYDIVVNVAGGVAGSGHSWSASSQNNIVQPTPTGTFTLDANGVRTFAVEVDTVALTGADTVTVSVT